MNLYTTIVTGIVLILSAITFYTLDMWLSVFANLANACIWISLFWFSLRNKREGVIA